MPIMTPGRQQVETAAYYCFKNGGELPGHDQADWLQGEQLVFLAENYDAVANYFLRGDDKQHVGPEADRRCRYCGGAGPFCQVAHAVPELIGNRAVIANDECDACNSLFAQSLEDHLGKFLLGALNLTRVRGKKGVPTLTTKARDSRIEVRGDEIIIRAVESDPMVRWDAEKRIVDVGVNTQPFVPLAVFKALTKMALAIMPATEIGHFHHAVNWIREKDHAKGSSDFGGPARAYLHFQPGPLPPDLGWVRLLRRRWPDAELPYMLFVALFRNVALQIAVPCCPLDNHWVNKQVRFPPYPVFYGFGYAYGEAVRRVLDLSSPTRQTVAFSGQLRAEVAAQVAP